MSLITGSNVLVTGGTGLAGSHLVEALIHEQPHKIVTTVRTRDPFSYFTMRGLEDQVVMAYGDIRDYERMADIVTKHEIDIIFHLAAQPIVHSAYRFPREVISSNVNGTANILEVARLSGQVKAVVVASSDKAYGASDVLPYKEDTKLEGLHPYDASKSATDLLARAYYKTYGLPVVVTRFGNIFGPGDDNFNRIIPGLIKALVHHQPFDVRSDGKMVREYLYVKDVAKGYVMLANQIEKCKGEAFNFGSSNVLSVLQVIEQVMAAYGSKIPVNILNIAKNEIPAQHLDYTKAKQWFDWQATTPFDAALTETIAWYQDYFKKISSKRSSL